MPIIATRDLSKRFNGSPAVDGVTFDVEAGEIFGFLGPNGAGKTTTVRMLTSALTPTSGSAEVAGVPVGPETGPELRRRIGVMPEEAGLYLKLSVHDNLEFFARLHGFKGPAAQRRIEAALVAVDLTARRDDRAGTLSKGLRQRAALARTLVADPEVLFLDEPTAGLDPEASLDVRHLIAALRERGVTVFLTTHRLEEAERLCDRVAIINGKLLSLGTPGELRHGIFGSGLEVVVGQALRDPGTLFGGLPGVTGWEGSDGRYRVDTDDPAALAPHLARAVVAAGADLVRLAEFTPSLEDTYLELIQGANG